MGLKEGWDEGDGGGGGEIGVSHFSKVGGLLVVGTN